MEKVFDLLNEGVVDFVTAIVKNDGRVCRAINKVTDTKQDWFGLDRFHLKAMFKNGYGVSVAKNADTGYVYEVAIVNNDGITYHPTVFDGNDLVRCRSNDEVTTLINKIAALPAKG